MPAIFTLKSGRALCAIALAILAGGLLGACKERSRPAEPASPPFPTTQRPALSPFNVAVRVNGQYAVLDQNGTMLVPFGKNIYGSFTTRPMKGMTALAKKNGQWQLVDLKTRLVIKKMGKNVYPDIDNPDYFGFEQDGKTGLMGLHGNVIQPPRFDDIYPGFPVVNGRASFIDFTIGRKYGALDIHGRQLADAVYDSNWRDDTASLGFHDKGGWLLARKGVQSWLVNLNDGTQQPVPYDELSDMTDGHMVVSSLNNPRRQWAFGLIDAQGHLVIPMNYGFLDTPSEGLLAFRPKMDGLCGYIDYQGKVMIPARFDRCEPFGKKGALAAMPDGKYGLIDRKGAWLVQPTYDGVGQAGDQWINGGYARGYSASSYTQPLSAPWARNFRNVLAAT